MQASLKKYFPIFVLPTLAAFAIAFLVPFIIGFFLSFTKFTTITDATWVGLENYGRVFQEREGFVSALSLIHISEPTRLHKVSRMPSSA